jgi:hypothetical protein
MSPRPSSAHFNGHLNGHLNGQSHGQSQFVLYLDSWGFVARQLDNQEPQDPTELEASQLHFCSVLCGLAKEYPQSQIEHSGDVAYIFSNSLEESVAFAFAAFKRMTVEDDRFHLRTLRGGIARGTLPIPLSLSSSLDRPNLHLSKHIGVGQVEAAKLEKSCQRGMRLFISKELGAEIEQGRKYPVRLNNTKGYEHWEACWVAPDPLHADYLNFRIEQRPVREIFIQISRELIEIPENSSQQLGSSINEMVRWYERLSPERR